MFLAATSLKKSDNGISLFYLLFVFFFVSFLKADIDVQKFLSFSLVVNVSLYEMRSATVAGVW